MTAATAVDGRAVIWRAVSERTWQDQVLRWATRAGWMAYHTYDSRRSASGFPDLLLLRDGRLIVAELKRWGRSLKTSQKIWLTAFRLVPGVEVYEWRPQDEDAVRRALA